MLIKIEGVTEDHNLQSVAEKFNSSDIKKVSICVEKQITQKTLFNNIQTFWRACKFTPSSQNSVKLLSDDKIEFNFTARGKDIPAISDLIFNSLKPANKKFKLSKIEGLFFEYFFQNIHYLPLHGQEKHLVSIKKLLSSFEWKTLSRNPAFFESQIDNLIEISNKIFGTSFIYEYNNVLNILNLPKKEIMFETNIAEDWFLYKKKIAEFEIESILLLSKIKDEFHLNESYIIMNEIVHPFDIFTTSTFESLMLRFFDEGILQIKDSWVSFNTKTIDKLPEKIKIREERIANIEKLLSYIKDKDFIICDNFNPFNGLKASTKSYLKDLMNMV